MNYLVHTYFKDCEKFLGWSNNSDFGHMHRIFRSVVTLIS